VKRLRGGGTLQPGEDKAWGGPLCVLNGSGMGGVNNTELDSLQWYPLNGEEAMGTD